MKSILTLGLTFILTLNWGFAERIEETPQTYKAALIASDSKNASLSDVAVEDRPMVLQTLRGIASGKVTKIGTISPNQTGAYTALVTLNDTPTIEILIAGYQKYDNRAAWDYIPKTLQRAANPAVIPYLALDFSMDESVDAHFGEPSKGSDFGVAAPPRSLYSGTIALRIIEKSPLFSESIKAWAKEAQLFRFKQPESFRRMMRIWWEQNQKAFEKGDYASVVSVPIKTYEAKSPEPVPQEASKPILADTPIPPTKEAAIVPVNPTVVQPPSIEHNPNWMVIVGAVIAVLLAGGGFIWLLRKPSKS